MAAFTSATYVSASDVSWDDEARVCTITGDHVISGSVTMTEKEKGATYIYSGAGRFALGNGASGQIGFDDHTTTIIEKSNRSSRYGGDNFNSTTSNDSPGCRIFGSNSGDNKNDITLKNVRWIIEVGSTRDDFDIHQGSSSDGASGPATRFEGVDVLLKGTQWSYPHCASRNIRFVNNPKLGYSMRLEQRSGVSVSFEFTNPLSNTASGLNFIEPQGGLANRGSNRPSSGGNSEQVAFNFQNVTNLEMTFAGLVCRSIGTQNANSSNKLVLIDPQVLNASNVASVGNPGRPNGGRDEGKLEIRRTQRINFTGDGINDGATIYADTTSTNADASSATGTTSGNSCDIVLPTHITLDESNSPTAIGTYRVIANDWSIRKTTETISELGTDAPAVINISTTNQSFPDGTAVTELSGAAAANSIDKIYQRLQKKELSDRNKPAWNEEICYIDTQGRLQLTPNVRLDTGPSDQSQVVQVLEDTPAAGKTTYRIKCASSIAASSRGITQLRSSGVIADSGNTTTSYLQSDDNGANASISYTGDSNNVYIGAYANDGTELAFAQYSGSATSFEATAAQTAAGNIKFAITRAGYEIATQELDASEGGVISIALKGGPQELLPTGAVAYNSSATTTGITAAFAVASGNPTLRLEIANVTASADGAYKVVQDGLITAAGNQFAAFGGKSPIYVKSDFQGSQFFLKDADNKLKRKESGNSNATFAAEVVPGATALDTTNGEVRFKIGGSFPEIPSATAVAAATLDAFDDDGLIYDEAFSAVEDATPSAADIVDAWLAKTMPVSPGDSTLAGKLNTAAGYTIPAAAPNAAAIETACEAAIEDKKTAIATAILGAANSSTDTTKVGGQVKAAASYTIPTPPAMITKAAVEEACESAIDDKKSDIAAAIDFPTKEEIATEIGEIPTPPTAEAIATEVGAPSTSAIATAVAGELTIPSKTDIAAAVAAELDLPDGDWLTNAELTAALANINVGGNVQINTADVERAVAEMQILPGVKLRGALKLALAQLIGGAKLEMRDSDNVNHTAKVPWLVFKSLDGATKIVEVKLGSENGERLLANVLPADINDAPPQT